MNNTIYLSKEQFIKKYYDLKLKDISLENDDSGEKKIVDTGLLFLGIMFILSLISVTYGFINPPIILIISAFPVVSLYYFLNKYYAKYKKIGLVIDSNYLTQLIRLTSYKNKIKIIQDFLGGKDKFKYSSRSCNTHDPEKGISPEIKDRGFTYIKNNKKYDFETHEGPDYFFILFSEILGDELHELFINNKSIEMKKGK